MIEGPADRQKSGEMLHLTNGDCAANSLRRAGLPGEVIVWSDVLHEGPAPAEHGPLWRQARAAYLSAAGYCSFETALGDLERADAELAEYSRHDELVLWLEHDLFDQLLLARHLHWLGTCGPAATRLSLICIDAFPGVEPFHGLGQLSPTQLASLFPSREPITRGQINAGADVWRAFTSDDPRPLAVIANRGIAELPFMAGAISRYLEEFPDAGDGLSRTERVVLELLREGPRSARDLFRLAQRREERVFMGDLSFWRVSYEMAGGPAPLVEKGTVPFLTAAEPLTPDTELRITELGLRVLEGDDAIRFRGIDRWMGGVHLTPRRIWRRDGHELVLGSADRF